MVSELERKKEAFVERLIQDTISGAISWHDYEAKIPGGSVRLDVSGDRSLVAGKYYDLIIHIEGLPENFLLIVKRPLLIALDVAIRNAGYAEKQRKEKIFYSFIDNYLAGGEK